MLIYWTDTQEIAIQLQEKYPEVDIFNLSFVDLKKMVESLRYFDDDDTSCNEKVLEAIQLSWFNERED